MSNSGLKPITAIDTRYSKDVQKLVNIFDDFTYYKHRFNVELEYFRVISQINIPSIEFTQDSYNEILRIESTTRHDVKAIEYYIKSLPIIIETGKLHLIHLGLTSQDVNSIGFTIMFRDSVNLLLNELNLLIENINTKIIEYDVPMLSFTHGQPAVPTTMKKELSVYTYRLTEQCKIITKMKDILRCKMGGANGNNNALYYLAETPKKLDLPYNNWSELFTDITAKFGLIRTPITTQCDDYDSVCNVLRTIQNCGHILESLRMNMWNYISRGYFQLANIAGEVGSSTMSHKINPIDFENSRTMLELANSEIDAICRIISVLSYQRDISDSSATRCISSVFGYFLIAVNRLNVGFARISGINKGRITRELEENSSVIIEGVQTYLKYYCGMGNAYEITKELTRGNTQFSMNDLHNFIESLEINTIHKINLHNLNVFNYSGEISSTNTNFTNK